MYLGTESCNELKKNLVSKKNIEDFETYFNFVLV